MSRLAAVHVPVGGGRKGDCPHRGTLPSYRFPDIPFLRQPLSAHKFPAGAGAVFPLRRLSVQGLAAYVSSDYRILWKNTGIFYGWFGDCLCIGLLQYVF